MAKSNPFINSLVLGFKVKAFYFYGRSSRSEFWYFYVTSWLVLALSFVLGLIPMVGQLIQAVLIILVAVCQITATIRRLHDINKPGFLTAIPYVLPLFYMLARQPVHALYPESIWVLTLLEILCGASLLGLLLLCALPGTKGDNKYGTDPLNHQAPSQDFINPQHFADPEYLGDPWRKFKAKVDREKQAAANGEAPIGHVARATPQAQTQAQTANSAPASAQSQPQDKTQTEEIEKNTAQDVPAPAQANSAQEAEVTTPKADVDAKTEKEEKEEAAKPQSSGSEPQQPNAKEQN